MINTWFISDTHFNHKNILEYEKAARPFNSIEDMNECIVDRWNSVVSNVDIVWHLGDFGFGKESLAIAKRLNGKKRLVLGNHDTYPSALYLESFEKLYGMVFWKGCVLSHMPVHNGGLGSRWLLNVHGHLHSNNVKTNNIPVIKAINNEVVIEKRNDLNYFNVSCEQNNLTPIHADIIIERMKLIQLGYQ